MSPPKTPQSAPFEGASLQAFFDLLAVRTGLHVRDKDNGMVTRTLASRAESQKLSAAAYLQKLRSESVDGTEWTQLMPLLTNGESYFERDKGQFALIRDTILPELIARRGSKEGTLRLWSAGCSTGEEAYSLAMATAATLPLGWKATILGTDINAEAIKKARRGIYGAWSFRGVDTATRDRYFRAVAGGFEVMPELRARVSFGFCNLSSSDWPDAGRGIADIDLILCRNVLIYFQRSVVAGVLSRFARTLRPDGFLLTGHAELHDQNVSPLRARLFPASAAYQKVDEARPSFPTASQSPRPPVADLNIKPVLRTLTTRTLPQSTAALSPTERPLSTLTPAPTPQQAPQTANDWYALAQRHADSGHYPEAVECCQKAIALNPAHADAYLLWAHIAEEQGKCNEAKERLKKVIYLAPTRAEAYVQLAAIYQREGDAARARQMRATALKLLQADTSGSDHTELKSHLQELLGESETARPETRRTGERR
ncbi:tetratricopeptide repeat protein [bacterium]|nr:MAG: tetratricopeptide repeat protein [bacterium]